MARLYRLFLISSSVALPCRCKFASLSKFVKKAWFIAICGRSLGKVIDKNNVPFSVFRVQ